MAAGDPDEKRGGRRANPGGRPKGSKNYRTKLREQIAEEIALRNQITEDVRALIPLGVRKKGLKALEDIAIESKKNQWKDFLTAKTYLKPVWGQLQDQYVDAEKNRVSIDNCSRFRDNFAQEILEHEKELQDLKEKADQKSAREAKIRDLQKVIEVKELEINLSQLEQAMDNLQPALVARKTALQQINSDIQNQEKALENSGMTDSTLLADWKSAAKEWQQLESTVQKKQEEKTALIKDISRLEEKIHALQQGLPEKQESFDMAIVTATNQLQILEKEKDMLGKKAGLAIHVHLLEEGKACPLCGSLSHPDPLEAEKESQALSSL